MNWLEEPGFVEESDKFKTLILEWTRKKAVLGEIVIDPGNAFLTLARGTIATLLEAELGMSEWLSEMIPTVEQ